MKDWKYVAVVVCTLLLLGFTSAQAQWTFKMVFPNDTVTTPSGLNNTIAVDPAGKIWMAAYYSGAAADWITGGADSISVHGVNKGVFKIYVYNSNGSLFTTYGPILNFNGTNDTLYTASTGYGMTTNYEGNIVLTKGSNVLRLINYKNGNELAMKANPLPGYTSSLAMPMVDSLDEVFITSVAPTTNVGPVALAGDFSSIFATVDTGMGGQYCRCVSVTPSGNDVYVHQYTLRGTVHYHSSSGTLGTYTIVDTLFKGLVIESSRWRPGTKQLWVSSGNVTSGMPDSEYTGYSWYGFDMTNLDHPVLQDSIHWNGATGIPADSIANDPRPRGIAFSNDGNTAYLGEFNGSKGFCEVFQKVGTSVDKVTSTVPAGYSLDQNYPNPFNPTTEINFAITKSGFTSLRVYDLLGREVSVLVNQQMNAGSYKVSFDASRLSSGTYIYELRSGDTRLVKKMMLLK